MSDKRLKLDPEAQDTIDQLARLLVEQAEEDLHSGVENQPKNDPV